MVMVPVIFIFLLIELVMCELFAVYCTLLLFLDVIAMIASYPN